MNKQQGPAETRTDSIKIEWTRINREESIVDQDWNTQEKGEEVAMRDLEKPVEQLLADIHQAHQMREEEVRKNKLDPRDPVLLTFYMQARTASMMAKIAISNDKLQQKVFWLTIVACALAGVQFLTAFCK